MDRGIGGAVGSAAIVSVDSKTAQFRWFLVDESFQGKGIGSRLIGAALDFCNESKFDTVFLWTFKGLDKARAIYDKAGFVLTEEKVNNEWRDVGIVEQKMELAMGEYRKK